MNDVVRIDHQARAVGARGAEEMRAHVQVVQEVMRSVMKDGVHYGKIPGTDKPSLLKAGAEKLCMAFHFGPDYEIVDKERDGDHLTIVSKCTLTHIPTGQKVGSALGSCSTMESKYAYRKGVRKCPQCSAEAIIKGKDEYGGGWLCYGKKGGCGAKFSDGDPAIEAQETGRIANEDKADQFNTVLKMSNKRALLAAVLNATAASDIFNQDLMEDGDDGNPEMTAAGQDAASRERAPARKVNQPKSKSAGAEPEMKGVDPGQKVNESQANLIRKTLERAGMTAEALCQHFKVDAVTDLLFKDINLVLKHITDSTPE